MKKFNMVYGYIIGFFIGMIIELLRGMITNYVMQIGIMLSLFFGGLWIVKQFEK